MRYGAVIAAAGRSSRMGAFKPLLEIEGETLISRTVRCFQAAGVQEVLVVTGYGRDLLEPAVHALGARTCYNPDHRTGDMFGSLRLGIRQLTGTCGRIFLTPGDIPLVQPETVRQLMAAEAAAVRPVCGGRPGHPVCLSAELAAAAASWEGSGGLKGALQALGLELAEIETADEGILRDADTPAELEELRDLARSRKEG